MRPTSVFLGAVVLVSSSPLAVAPPAGGAEGTPCSAEVDLTIAPGLSNTPSSGTWTTNGETGTITCTGRLGGSEITGPGTIGGHGRYGVNDPDTCRGGEADGPQFFSIPTSGGIQHITNDHFSTYGPLEGGGVYGGEFHGPRFSGTFQARPVEGDCVSAPITKAHFTIKAALSRYVRTQNGALAGGPYDPIRFPREADDRRGGPAMTGSGPCSGTPQRFSTDEIVDILASTEVFGALDGDALVDLVLHFDTFGRPARQEGGPWRE